MSDRLPWVRGEQPRQFIATLPEGHAELWYHDQGAQMERGWRFRLIAGETVELARTHGADKQAAADEATAKWPNVVLVPVPQGSVTCRGWRAMRLDPLPLAVMYVDRCNLALGHGDRDLIEAGDNITRGVAAGDIGPHVRIG